MGASMVIYALYVDAAKGFDLAAAIAKADELVDGADAEDLLHVVDGLPGGEVDEDDEDSDIPALRSEARTWLRDELKSFAESIVGHMVASHVIGGIAVYMTGGMSSGDGAGAADDWDVLCAGERLPEHWSQMIGSAAGLMDSARSDPDTPHVVVFEPWPVSVPAS